MNSSISFSNTALSMRKLMKISSLLDNNDNIQSMSIYSWRNVKDNGIKTRDSHSFNDIVSLINYLEENNVNSLEGLEINIYYKNKNNARFEYDDFEHRWELSYYNQDENIDSLIFNLKPLLKNSIFKFFRQYRMFILIMLSVLDLILISSNYLNEYFARLINIVFAILFVDIFLIKNIPYREYKFLSRNKDSIILSIIFYVLGLITPFIPKIISFIFG